jgi:outer membrane immunogenic protein
MKRLLLASALAALFSLPSNAADLPTRPVAVTTPAPAFSWTGFYVGVNAGYGWASVSDNSGLPSSNLNGFIGGGQIGYNYQINALVFGIEGDFQGSTQKNSTSGAVLGVPFTVDQKLPYFGTIRGRVGVALNRTLLYFTGGWAYANYKVDVTALGVTVSSNASSSAWTVGGGVEQALWDRWSAKLEYLYIDTGSTNITLFGTTVTGRAKDNLVRAGLNYRF